MDNKWLSTTPIVLDTSTLHHAFKGYRRINDKISYMAAKNELIPLIKGKYVSGEAYRSGLVSTYAVANNLYGPSYISGYTALAYYQIIPEKVVSIESVTPLRSKRITTPIGRFVYYKTPEASFHIGIKHITLDETSFLIASPTKAMVDALWVTKILDVHGVKSMASYLFDNLRIDESSFAVFDEATIVACQELGKKKQLLQHLIKLLRQFQN